mgnify:CR=1 FL=1
MEKQKVKDLQEEVERLKSHNLITSTFEYDGYRFRYTETCVAAKVIVESYREYEVKPLSQEAFKTWCVCWVVDHRAERK